MLLITSQFGELHIEEDQIISFPVGILAFEDVKKFILIPVHNNPFFKWLLSIDEPNLSFLLTDPFSIKSEYYVDLNDNVKEELSIENQEDVLIYTIVTIPNRDFKKATTNLLAPIVINLKEKKAQQIVLDGNSSNIRYPLFQSETLKVSGE